MPLGHEIWLFIRICLSGKKVREKYLRKKKLGLLLRLEMSSKCIPSLLLILSSRNWKIHWNGRNQFQTKKPKRNSKSAVIHHHSQLSRFFLYLVVVKYLLKIENLLAHNECSGPVLWSYYYTLYRCKHKANLYKWHTIFQQMSIKLGANFTKEWTMLLVVVDKNI